MTQKSTIAKRRDWKNGETPYCEVESTGFRKLPSGQSEMFITMTPRGVREFKRRRKAERARELYLKKHPPKNSGKWLSWFLFGPFKSNGKPVFS